MTSSNGPTLCLTTPNLSSASETNTTMPKPVASRCQQITYSESHKAPSAAKITPPKTSKSQRQQQRPYSFADGSGVCDPLINMTVLFRANRPKASTRIELGSDLTANLWVPPSFTGQSAAEKPPQHHNKADENMSRAELSLANKTNPTMTSSAKHGGESSNQNFMTLVDVASSVRDEQVKVSAQRQSPNKAPVSHAGALANQGVTAVNQPAKSTPQPIRSHDPSVALPGLIPHSQIKKVFCFHCFNSL